MAAATGVGISEIGWNSRSDFPHSYASATSDEYARLAVVGRASRTLLRTILVLLNFAWPLGVRTVERAAIRGAAMVHDSEALRAGAALFAVSVLAGGYEPSLPVESSVRHFSDHVGVGAEQPRRCSRGVGAQQV
ncbi:hypothetical protein BDB13_4058 [Rhodococcus sp. OK302]|nr:hypothetical protein BDB13_4058 [Rhodococcus sp. OK302]